MKARSGENANQSFKHQWKINDFGFFGPFSGGIIRAPPMPDEVGFRCVLAARSGQRQSRDRIVRVQRRME
eukprot:473957-Pyramimonas_sp.AAC.1